MRIWIYSGRPSDGAKLLAQEDEFGRLRPGKLVKSNDIIVNWGNAGQINLITKYRKINSLGAVANAVDKLKTFRILHDAKINIVPWTIDKAVAKSWLQAGDIVVARKTLTGHEGAGIIIVEKVNELPEAPLYTKYIHKVKEFRVHATQYGVIDTQQKVRDPNRVPTSWKVRSYNNGFIFQRHNVQSSPVRDALAIKTVKALGLDFAALDIIEDKGGHFYVLEANTAPGIAGTTVKLYAKALHEIAQRIVNPEKIKVGIRNLNLGWAA